MDPCASPNPDSSSLVQSIFEQNSQNFKLLLEAATKGVQLSSADFKTIVLSNNDLSRFSMSQSK